jgi:hypothetical protein
MEYGFAAFPIVCFMEIVVVWMELKSDGRAENRVLYCGNIFFPSIDRNNRNKPYGHVYDDFVKSQTE